jgi:hypothetical protein
MTGYPMASRFEMCGVAALLIKRAVFSPGVQPLLR